MRSTKIFFISFLTLPLLFGCAREITPEVPADPDLIPLNIDGRINQVQTKATAEGFVDKDALGLFAVNYSDNNTVAGTLISEGNQADNVKYIFDETNQKWNPVKAVYYKDVNTNADLYVYYPFQSSINDVNSANFEVKQDQSSPETETELSGYEASDFLWGKTGNVTPTESKVAISLSHRLSAVQVTLVEGNGFDESEFADLEKSLILTNTTRKATIDYATGEATPLGNPQLNGIVMCPQEDGAFRAIVIPQTVTGGEKLFAITLGGTSYSFSQSADVTYQAGKQMNVSISVNKKVPTGEYELVLADAQIVDWVEDRNTHGGEARQYFVVNVETPGTLGATIEAMGKNPAKIKNLKVTGQITTEDFYFMRDEMTILEAINLKEVKVKDCYQQGEYYEKDGEWRYWDEGQWDDVIPQRAFMGKQSLCYFSFPENISHICDHAFSMSGLSGALIIPDKVVSIGLSAFASTRISSVSFPQSLTSISEGAFENCSSLSGNLVLNNYLQYIGRGAFSGCNFTGLLHLPNSLSYIGGDAFHDAGNFIGGLRLPDNITKLEGGTFWASGRVAFNGQLDLNNVTEVGYNEFYGCGFSGELIIPEGLSEIPPLFCGSYMPSKPGNLTSIVFPQSLKEIGENAFSNQSALMSVEINDGLLVIGKEAFSGCYHLLSINFPSTLQTIGERAFSLNYSLSSIICSSVEPPTVQSNAFEGVGKDNCMVEVPPQSIKKYQSESGWQDFKRIAVHYDFSISHERMRALNAEITRTYTLRAPANFTWSIESKPDWVTVVPESGIGKTDVTITVNAMARINDTFEVNEGSYNNPSYKYYRGRCGEIVFKLDDKNYTCSMSIEQYDSDYVDGDVKTYHSATKGSGIDIIFIGEGYDAKDIAKGDFFSNVEEGYDYFFDLEPYKSYKDYFNVYAVVSMSNESGIGTVNTIVDNKFGTYFSQNRILTPAAEPCFAWARIADFNVDYTKALVINLMNTSTYEGITAMYGDGSAIAFCPVSREAYPYDFRGIIQHEAGGHGFGKLGDEYIYHNAFIQNCTCIDGCEHPQSDHDMFTSYGIFKSHGWYKNLSMTSDPYKVPWTHLLYNPLYSDYVDMYEGGYMHTRGMFRSEATSCMNNNIPYYSAISRQAIVERIMDCAGEEFSLDSFYAKDSDAFGTITKTASPYIDRTFGVDPLWNRGSEEGSVIYMGEHPDYSKMNN